MFSPRSGSVKSVAMLEEKGVRNENQEGYARSPSGEGSVDLIRVDAKLPNRVCHDVAADGPRLS